MDFLELMFICVLGGLSGGFSIFIDFCFNEGNIFDWYYSLIQDYVKPKSEKLFKMLGGCNICFNPYLSTILFVILSENFKISIKYYIPFILTSILYNLYLNKYFDKND